jgi:hypothetical protein
MKFILAFFFSALLMYSCKNNSSEKSVAKSTADTTGLPDTATAKKEDFFPVSAYIGGQLKMIDSLQLPLSIAITVNNNTRYAVATDKQLRQWASLFQQPDINDPALRSQYKETNIADESGPSVTLIYTALNDMLPVQKINVFIKPDPVQNDKVTGVYIEKIFSANDTSYSQKLYWKTGKNLQVTTEKKVKNTSFPLEQVKITWDPS